MSQPNQQGNAQEPVGLGIHNQGSTAENAHQQGWGTEEDTRKQASVEQQQQTGGGADYEYGAQDFGDVPVNEHGVKPAQEAVEFIMGKQKVGVGD